MPTPNLPPKLLLKIFSDFKADLILTSPEARPTLAACCLVSRAWLEPARDVLYSAIPVKLSMGAKKNVCVEIAAERLNGTVNEVMKLGVASSSATACRHTPSLVARVHQLTLEGAHRHHLRDEGAPLEAFYSTETLATALGAVTKLGLEALPELKAIQLKAARGWELQGLAQIALHLEPQITSLTLRTP